MNRQIGGISLENQDARPLRVVRVVLDHDGAVETVDNITNANTVRSKFLVPMK